MFGCLYLIVPIDQDVNTFAPKLIDLARDFTPRYEVLTSRTVVLDLSGLERLFGDPTALAREISRNATERSLVVRVGIARTLVTALVAAHARAGMTIVPAGTEAAFLASLPIRIMFEALQGWPDLNETRSPVGRRLQQSTAVEAGRGSFDNLQAVLKRWGIHTIGQFASLPAGPLSERLGQKGLTWQRLARGEEVRLLVPTISQEPFRETLDLEWPIETLEPLSFVLGRLFEPLCARLAREDLGATVLHVGLRLVDRRDHLRTIQLPAPMRDARVLRTLALLDLESHLPDEAIDAITVAVDVAPGRVVQHSLLHRPLPASESVTTLLARLTALMGTGRCGAPALIQSYHPGAFAMTEFQVTSDTRERQDVHLDRLPRRNPALRAWRIADPARVMLQAGRPVRVSLTGSETRGGRVEVAAGPWKASGEWWRIGKRSGAAESTGKDASSAPLDRTAFDRPQAWSRMEWDVLLSDGVLYRLYFDHLQERWFVDGVID